MGVAEHDGRVVQGEGCGDIVDPTDVARFTVHPTGGRSFEEHRDVEDSAEAYLGSLVSDQRKENGDLIAKNIERRICTAQTFYDCDT